MFNDGNFRITAISEEIKDSLLPVFSELLDATRKKFQDGKITANLIEEVQNQAIGIEDYEVSANFNLKVNNFYSMTPELQRATLQTYADKTAEAKKAAATNLQRCLYFESQWTASEKAKKRLLQLFDEIQPKIEEDFLIAAEREKIRIESLKKMQNNLKMILEDNRKLKKQLDDKTNEIKEDEVRIHDLNENVKELRKNLSESEKKRKETSERAASLKVELETVRKKNEEMNSELRTLKNEKENLAAEHSRLTRSSHKLKAESENEMKRYENELQKHFTIEMDQIRQQTKEALTKADEEVRKKEKQLEYYYRKYQEVKKNYENLQKKTEQELSRAHWHAINSIRGMTPRNGKYLEEPIRNNGIIGRMREAAETSASEVENLEPPRPKQMKRSNSLAQTARHYNVRPTFDKK